MSLGHQGYSRQMLLLFWQKFNYMKEIGLPLAILEHVLSNAKLSTHSTTVQKVDMRAAEYLNETCSSSHEACLEEPHVIGLTCNTVICIMFIFLSFTLPRLLWF